LSFRDRFVNDVVEKFSGQFDGLAAIGLYRLVPKQTASAT